MKPRRTHESNVIFRLEGGTEDHDLWATRGTLEEGGSPVILSVWEPSEAERAEIAAGANIALVIWGCVQPPVAVETTDVPLGRALSMEDESA